MEEMSIEQKIESIFRRHRKTGMLWPPPEPYGDIIEMLKEKIKILEEGRAVSTSIKNEDLKIEAINLPNAFYENIEMLREEIKRLQESQTVNVMLGVMGESSENTVNE